MAALAHAVTLIVLGMLCAGATASVVHTQGTAGEQCEHGGRRCLYPEAYCKDGQCVCKDGLIGAGDFYCREPKFRNKVTSLVKYEYCNNCTNCRETCTRCGKTCCCAVQVSSICTQTRCENKTSPSPGEVVNDPVLHSMNGEKTDMPLTCRYLFTHVTSIYSNLPGSFCTLQVNLFQSKLNRRVYVQGIDIALKVETPSLTQSVASFSARICGNASNGLYTFDERGQLEFTPDGPWQEDGPLSAQLPGGTKVAVTYDSDNNRAKFDVPDCGFKVAFRPADMHQSMHVMPKPGVAVDVDHAHSPVFKDPARCLNIAPQQHHLLHDMAASLGVSGGQAQIYKAFMSGVTQNQPDAAPNCNKVPVTLKGCPQAQLHDAMDKCHFIIAHHEVTQCLDNSNNGNGNIMLGHYNRCLKAICSRSKVMCETVQSDLGQCQQFGEVKQFQRAETCDF